MQLRPLVQGLQIAQALQKARAVSFQQQLAFIGLVTGLVLFGFGAFRGGRIEQW